MSLSQSFVVVDGSRNEEASSHREESNEKAYEHGDVSIIQHIGVSLLKLALKRVGLAAVQVVSSLLKLVRSFSPLLYDAMHERLIKVFLFVEDVIAHPKDIILANQVESLVVTLYK